MNSSIFVFCLFGVWLQVSSLNHIMEEFSLQNNNLEINIIFNCNCWC